MRADHAVRYCLGRDRDEAVGCARSGGQGVRAPQPYAVDVKADPDVLTRQVPAPRATGAQYDGDCYGGLGTYLDDPGAQVGTGAERPEHVEVVSRIGG